MTEGLRRKVSQAAEETVTAKSIPLRLVDQLSDNEVPVTACNVEYLRDMGDPLLRALTEAPEDDKPTTGLEDRDASEAWEEYLRGEAISADDAKRELLR